MKIGLYGGVANNMYVFAKALAKKGLNICFIRDRGDHYPFSQPVWEDIPCRLNYDEMAEAEKRTWKEWTEWEDRNQWRAPSWLFDPLDEFVPSMDMYHTVPEFLDRAILHCLARKKKHWHQVLKLMTDCEILLVCGIEGSILAWASGKPFVIWPHGEDIRTAAGLNPPQSNNPYIWLNYKIRLRLLRLAYQRVLWIGTHDAKAIGGHIGEIPSSFPMKFLGIPLPIRERLPKEKRRDLLSNLVDRLGMKMPAAEKIGFVPSRVDFFWKGHDLLFRALSRTPKKEKIHLFVSGWGENFQEGRQMVSSHLLTFLPFVVSKPILYDFYRGVDFVADQFRMGSYGTAAVEAMSCGTPVMMRIDVEAFRKRNWEPPPVLNTEDEEGSINFFSGIALEQIDLDEVGRAAHEWVRRNHSEESATISFLKEIQNRTVF